MSSKARVTTRLKQAVGTSKSSNTSSDLASAAGNFEVMKKRLKLLISSLKAHHQALLHVHKTRSDAVQLVATFSLNSPIFECAGELCSEGKNVLSYASVHSSMASQQKIFGDKYGQFVVNYAVEWERVLTERITQGLKKSNEMRVELDHYEEKLKSIRMTVNVAIAREKKIDPKLSEKLRRNEEKFKTAKIGYEKYVHALTVLIDEATLRSWKDLHPLLVKMIQYDCTVVKSQAKSLSGLDIVVSKLKNFAQEHNIPQSRLKDLQSMNPFELSGLNEQEYLALHASPETNDYIKSESAANNAYDVNANYLEFTSSAPRAITQDPNSWGAQSGLVPQQSSNSLDFTVPTTDEMLAIKCNSVPPPTMESLNNATDHLTLSSNNSNNYAGGNFGSNSGNNFGNNMNNVNNNSGNNMNNNFNNNSGNNMNNNFNNNSGNNMNSNFNNNSGNNNMNSNFNNNSGNNSMNHFNNNSGNMNGNFNNNSGNNNMNNFNNNSGNNNMNNGYSNNSNNFNNNAGMSNNVNNNSYSNDNNFNNSDPFSGPPQTDLPRLHAPMPSGAPPPPPPQSDRNPFNSGGNGMYNDGMLTPYGGQQNSNQAGTNQQLSLTSPTAHSNPKDMSSSTSFDDPFSGF